MDRRTLGEKDEKAKKVKGLVKKKKKKNVKDFEREEIDRQIALSIAEEDKKEKKVKDFEREEIDRQIALSIAEEDKKEKKVKDFKREEIDRQLALSIAEEDKKGKKVKDSQLKEDEQLAKALQESVYVESPPRSAPRQHGRFRCHSCGRPISEREYSVLDNRPYHKSCFMELHHPKCDVCKNFIPMNGAGRVEYIAHPLWPQKYCPWHGHDGTPRCCSCEKMVPADAQYLHLEDGRKLCLECLDSSIMDTNECKSLYLEIKHFYEGLNMKVEQQVPLLLVERQALNEAMEGEKKGNHHVSETRGLCLSEEQIITMVSRRPTIDGYRILDSFTEPYRLVRRCEVTAILVLYGLPRLLTGSILAHEMMHAWLRLKGYPALTPKVEEGICHVLAHMWLVSEIAGGSSSKAASTSSSSPSSSKEGKRSQFERRLGEFFKHQIETNSCPVYGDGFREGNEAVEKYGLKSTLDHIYLTGCFPC